MTHLRHEKDKNKEKKDILINNVRIFLDVRILFRFQKEIDDTTIKDIINLFSLKKESKAVKDRVIRDIRSLFEHEEENYQKPVKVGNFCSNNYFEYGSIGDRNITLSIEEYIDKFIPYLKDIIKHLEVKLMNSLKNFFNHFFLYAKLQTSMRGSDFVFDCNHLLHCKRNKINLN